MSRRGFGAPSDQPSNLAIATSLSQLREEEQLGLEKARLESEKAKTMEERRRTEIQRKKLYEQEKAVAANARALRDEMRALNKQREDLAVRNTPMNCKCSLCFVQAC